LWLPLSNEKATDAGSILMNFQLVPEHFVGSIPRQLPDLYPRMNVYYLEVLTLGLRSLSSTLGIHKTKATFTLPTGDTFGTDLSSLPSRNNPNFLQTLKRVVAVPRKDIFTAVLDVKAMDSLFGGLSQRCVGSGTVNLHKFLQADPTHPNDKRTTVCEMMIATDAAVSDPNARRFEFEAFKLEQKKKAKLVEQQEREMERFEDERKANQARFEAKQKELIEKRDQRNAEKRAKQSDGKESGEVKTSDTKESETKESDENKEMTEKKSDDLKISVAPETGEDPLSEDDLEDEPLLADQFELVHVNDPGGKREMPTLAPYMVGRVELKNTLEDVMDLSPFLTIPLTTGGFTFGKTDAVLERQVGSWKGLIRLIDPADETDNRFEVIEHELKPKALVLRLYALQAFGLVGHDHNGKNDPYLVVKVGNQKQSTRKRHLSNVNDADFFEAFEFPITLPGDAFLDIELWDWDGVGDDLIGSVRIDIENRWFTTDWRTLDLKPVEIHQVRLPTRETPQGTLRLWLDILEPEKTKEHPLIDIKPPPPQEFELRVVCWSVWDCPDMDWEGMSDLYCQFRCSSTNKFVRTDTHYRAQGGKGNFNWRVKFPILLPKHFGSARLGLALPQLTMQIWDRDLILSNDPICSLDLRLKRLASHCMRSGRRCYLSDKGDKDVIFSFSLPDKIKASAKSNRDPQMKVRIELLPKDIADDLKAGKGRDQPNQNPFLPEPEGRFRFDLCSPLQMLRACCGDKTLAKLACFICCALTLTALIYFAPMVFSAWISKNLTGG
jgi:hypothetical protein